MTEPSGRPRGEREPAEQAVEHLKGKLEAIGEMALAVNNVPDLSDVWTDPDYQSLPEAARAELRAWAVSRGYAKEEPKAAAGKPEAAAKEAAAEPEENDETVKSLMARAEVLAEMALAVSSKPDLSDVWTDPEFLALDPAAQGRLRAWADRHGYGAAPAPSAAPKRAVEAPRAEAVPASAQTDAPESERKDKQPRKRQFLGYRLKRKEEDGEYIIIEDFEEWDRQAEEYKKRSVRTAIEIPAGLAERMKADAALEAEVAAYAAVLREELDNKVKIFVDRRKDDDRIFPKWKFPLGGKTVEQPIRVEELPDEIVELVKREPEHYHRAPEWKKWFGKQMQKKRETTIGDEMAKKYAPGETVPAAPETREEAPAPAPEARAEAPRAEAREWRPEELRAGIRVLVEKLAPLFETPTDAPKLVEYLTDFARGSLMRRAGGTVPEAKLAEMIREALTEHYRGAGDDGSLQAIERLLPTREAKERAVAKEEAEATFGKAYVALRARVDAVGRPRELAALVAELREARKSGVGDVRDAAGKMLLDIEQGKAGPVTEDDMEGVVRTGEEVAFFKAHPALDKRNVEALRDGRVIAHIDRMRPDEAIRRALDRATEDALGGPARTEAERAVRARVADYFAKIVEGRHGNEEVTDKVRAALLDYDGRAGELVIKDIAKLKDAVAGLRNDVLRQASAKG